MGDRYTDATDNEIASRKRNEWIEATSASFGTTARLDRYVCECSFSGCSSTMDLSREEYEAVRRDGSRFAISINHEDPEIERVVVEYPRYAVVEKWFGEPRRMANDTNPRRPTLPSSNDPPEVDHSRTPGADRP